MNAFATASDLDTVNLLDSAVLSGILIGALCPFVFAALTMLSVGKAAESIMYECRRQLNEIHFGKRTKPDAQACVAISTQASLKEMVAPGTIAVFTPVICGTLLGTAGLMGVLGGAISSGFLLAVTMSNAGGAWDNAKKYVESIGKKHTSEHVAVVVGDTVGDPFKDTSGPALNILIKLMSVVSLLLAPLFDSYAWSPDKWPIGLGCIFAVAIFLIIFQKCFNSDSDSSDRDEIDAQAKTRKADQAGREMKENNLVSAVDAHPEVLAVNTSIEEAVEALNQLRE